MNGFKCLVCMAGLALSLPCKVTAGPVEIKMRCGGPNEAYVASNGDVYEPDRAYGSGAPPYRGYIDGRQFVRGVNLHEGSSDPELYRYVRLAFSEYRFDVPDGWYAVNLHLCEHKLHGAGSRVLNIELEGEIVETAIDLIPMVNKDYAVPYVFAVEVNDGTLNLAMPSIAGESSMAAVTVKAVTPDEVPPLPPIAVEAIGGFRRNILRWTTDPPVDMAGYNVYASSSFDGPYEQVNDKLVRPRRYLDDDVTVGFERFYRISAVDIWGNESDLSETLSAAPVDDDDSQLPVYTLRVSDADLATLNANPFSDDTVPAMLEHEDEEWPEITARFRGNTARQLNKKNWRLKFPNANLFGDREIAYFATSRREETYLRDVLSYDLFDRAGLMSLTTDYCHLNLNDQYYGLMFILERYDEAFLRRIGQSAGIYRGHELLPESDLNAYVRAYEMKAGEDSGHAYLVELIERINTPQSEAFPLTIRKIVDLPQVLDYLALTVLSAGSTGIGVNDNSFLFHDLDDGLWRMLPWDKDLSFITIDQIDASMTHQLQIRLMEYPPFRDYFCDRMASLIGNEFAAQPLHSMIDDLHDLIAFDGHRDIEKIGREDNHAFDSLAWLKAWIVSRGNQMLGEIPDYRFGNGPYLYLNEMMADNASTISDESQEFDDWIEVYNAEVVGLDLSGMYLTNDLSNPTKWRIPDGLIVPGGGWVLFWADGQTQQGPLHASFELDETGGEIALFSSNGVTRIDALVYGPQTPDVSYGRDPDGSDMIGFPVAATPGAQNMIPEYDPPRITETRHTPHFPGRGDEILVTARVTHDLHIDSVDLFYSRDGVERLPIPMFDDGKSGDGDPGDGIYGGTIPSTLYFDEITYSIVAVAENGYSGFDPATAPVGYSIDLSDGPQPLYVNEIMALNDSTIHDEHGDFDDWIEVYNESQSDVDMSGMYLTDDLADPLQWQIPEGVIVPARGFVVFWADGEPEEGPMHTSFQLSGNGEQVGIFDPTGPETFTLDTVTYGLQQSDVSYGRESDGAGGFRFFETPSPGEPNGAACPGDVDRNGNVDLTDLLTVLVQWGPCGFCKGDIDFDGVVGFSDLLIVLGAWGPCL